MQFTLVAQLNKIIWQDETQGRYLLSMKNENKTWTVWSDYKPDFNTIYTIHGVVSESPDKKVKDQNGKAIYRTQFNAEGWNANDGVTLNTSDEDIPF